MFTLTFSKLSESIYVSAKSLTNTKEVFSGEFGIDNIPGLPSRCVDIDKALEFLETISKEEDNKGFQKRFISRRRGVEGFEDITDFLGTDTADSLEKGPYLECLLENDFVGVKISLVLKKVCEQVICEGLESTIMIRKLQDEIDTLKTIFYSAEIIALGGAILRRDVENLVLIYTYKFEKWISDTMANVDEKSKGMLALNRVAVTYSPDLTQIDEVFYKLRSFSLYANVLDHRKPGGPCNKLSFLRLMISDTKSYRLQNIQPGINFDHFKDLIRENVIVEFNTTLTEAQLDVISSRSNEELINLNIIGDSLTKCKKVSVDKNLLKFFNKAKIKYIVQLRLPCNNALPETEKRICEAEKLEFVPIEK